MQHVNHAAPGNCIADTGEKLRPCLQVGFRPKIFHRIGPGILQEAEQAHGIKGVFRVVIVFSTLLVAVMIDRSADDKGFISGFFGI